MGRRDATDAQPFEERFFRTRRHRAGSPRPPLSPRVRATTATAGRDAQASRRQGGGDAIGGAAREVERDDGGGAARSERCDPADRSLLVVKRPDPYVPRHLYQVRAATTGRTAAGRSVAARAAARRVPATR